jgi:hypothetical protein
VRVSSDFGVGLGLSLVCELRGLDVFGFMR